MQKRCLTLPLLSPGLFRPRDTGIVLELSIELGDRIRYCSSKRVNLIGAPSPSSGWLPTGLGCPKVRVVICDYARPSAGLGGCLVVELQSADGSRMRSEKAYTSLTYLDIHSGQGKRSHRASQHGAGASPSRLRPSNGLADRQVGASHQ